MTDWIVRVMEALGYWGIALLTFLENIVPPIPSEVVMPLAGFTARQGQLSVWGVILAGTLGSLAGTTAWYWVARKVGAQRVEAWVRRHGRWIGVSLDELKRAEEWFRRWRGPATLLARMVPGIRTLISVPAGVVRMPFLPFLAYSLVGTALWTGLLTGLGWLLGSQYELVDRYIGWIGAAVIGGLVLWFAIRAWRRWDRQPEAT